MKGIYKEDVVSTYRERFKKHPNPRINKLSKKDIDELWDEICEGLMEILVAASKGYFDAIRLGSSGHIKLSIRQPQEIKDVSSGKKITTNPTPLFYFKASPELKRRIRKVLIEKMKNK